LVEIDETNLLTLVTRDWIIFVKYKQKCHYSYFAKKNLEGPETSARHLHLIFAMGNTLCPSSFPVAANSFSEWKIYAQERPGPISFRVPDEAQLVGMAGK